MNTRIVDGSRIWKRRKERKFVLLQKIYWGFKLSREHALWKKRNRFSDSFAIFSFDFAKKRKSKAPDKSEYCRD